MELLISEFLVVVESLKISLALLKNCSKNEVMLHPGKQKVFLILFSNVSEVRIS